MKRPHPHSAFTLIELLVVISIISLLMAILLPSLSRARQVAMSISCGSNLKQVYTMMLLYTQDNRDTLPGNVWSNYPHRITQTWPGQADTTNVKYGLWYLTDSQLDGFYSLFLCPSNLTSALYKKTSGWALAGYTTYFMLNNFPHYPDSDPNDNRKNGGRIDDWTAEQVMVQDWLFVELAPSATGITNSHEFGGNGMFADGHVKFMGRDQFTLLYGSPCTGLGSLHPRYYQPMTSWYSVYASPAAP